MQEENLEKENVFLPVGEIILEDKIVMENFEKTFYFKYVGKGEVVIGKLSGNPQSTGIMAEKVVHEPNGLYSVRIHGAPRKINKNVFELRLTDDRDNRKEFPIVFQVQGVEIEDSLPDAIGLFRPYKAQIYFTNPSNQKPKFFYLFPLEFGKVNTQVEEGKNFTTILFNPTREGKFKFLMEALCERDVDNPDDKEVLLGARTLHVKVVDDSPKPETGKLKSVQSVDIKNWR